MVQTIASKKTPEQMLQEVSDVLADSLKGFIGDTITPDMLEELKLTLMSAMIGSAGYDLQFEQVPGNPDAIRPANRLTAYCMIAYRMGLPMPDPNDLKESWETELGTISFDDETKDVTLIPKKSVDYIELKFTV